MSIINKQALRSKARSASAGEWIKESGDGWEAICSTNDQANGNFIIAHFEGPDAKANREFAQAAHPDVVLALLDELEAAERRNAELEDLLEAEVRLWTQRYDCANSRREAAEKRVAELEALTAPQLPQPVQVSVDFTLIRRALANAGISAPESDEELGSSHIRQILRFVAEQEA